MAKTKNEFADLDSDTEVSNSNNNGSSTDLSEFDPEKDGNTESSALSSSDIRNLGFDDEADRAVKSRMTPPIGDWNKTSKWEMKEFVVQGDCQVGDINPLGRTIWRFYGKVDERTDRDGNVHEPILSFTISRDKRFKRDEPGKGKDDLNTRMFVMAKDLYFDIKEEKPTSIGQLWDMLIEDDYTLNTLAGDQGLFVLRIKATKQRR